MTSINTFVRADITSISSIRESDCRTVIVGQNAENKRDKRDNHAPQFIHVALHMWSLKGMNIKLVGRVARFQHPKCTSKIIPQLQLKNRTKDLKPVQNCEHWTRQTHFSSLCKSLHGIYSLTVVHTNFGIL